MQGLNRTLDEMFQSMQERLLKDILRVLGNDRLIKSAISLGGQRAQHKYIKREGPPGGPYRYWYQDSLGHVYHGDNAPASHADHNSQQPEFNPRKTLQAKPNSKKVIVSGAKSTGVGHNVKTVDQAAIEYNNITKTPGTKSNYKSSTTTNMVENVHFGSARPEVEAELIKGLESADKVVASMGVRFKRPIRFFCDEIGQGQVQALYAPVQQSNNKWEQLIKLENAGHINKSLMHEIGHALDFSMESTGKGLTPRSANEQIKNKELRTLHAQLKEVVSKSAFYKFNPARRDKDYQDYLNEPSEMFARAFEVYSLVKAKEMVANGELDQEFLHKFYPDLYKDTIIEDFRDSNEYKNYLVRTEALDNKKRKLFKEGLNATSPEIKEVSNLQRELSDAYSKRFKDPKPFVDISINNVDEEALNNKIVSIMDKILKIDSIKKSLQNFEFMKIINGINRT